MFKILGAILVALTLTPIMMIITIKSVTPFAKQWNETVEKISKKGLK